MELEAAGFLIGKSLLSGVAGAVGGLWLRGVFLRGDTKRRLRQQIDKIENCVGKAYVQIANGPNSGWTITDRPIERHAREIWSLLKMLETLTWWANRSGNRLREGQTAAELLELFGAFDRLYCGDGGTGSGAFKSLRSKGRETIEIIENIPSAIDTVRDVVGLRHPSRVLIFGRKSVVKRFPCRDSAIAVVKNDKNLPTAGGIFLSE